MYPSQREMVSYLLRIRFLPPEVIMEALKNSEAILKT